MKFPALLPKALTAALLSICAAIYVHAADGDLFPYPKAPDEKVLLSERCNYIVDHFWDRCNFKTAFSRRESLHNTFGDWVMLMPHATADTVHMAIDRLLASISKNGPQTLAMAQMAEAWLYSDTSEIHSEELYLPFAKAAADNKKISGAERERFKAQVKVLETSGLGSKLPSTLTFKEGDGSQQPIADGRAENILLAFVDPGCSDCSTDMLRLGIDLNARQLIEKGSLGITVIYPDEVSEAWTAKASGMPKTWKTGTMPDADEYFDLSTIPSYMFIDRNGIVIIKGVDMERILNLFYRLNTVRK